MLRMPIACLFALQMLSIPLRAEAPKPAAVQIAGRVYMIEGSGAGNIGVITHPNGTVIIDTMMAASADDVRSAIRPLPGGDTIRFLINTHWHSDHTDGNKALGPGTVIIAHDNVRPLLAAAQSLMGQTTPALPAEALPVITFSDRLTLHAGDTPVQLIHFPGAHTNGDTVVYIERFRVIHMGDMFFNGLFPFLDVANGGSIESWIRHLDTILKMLPEDAKIIPGHGPLAGPSELKAFREMLSESASIVRRRIQSGNGLDQIKAAGLPESFAPWTKGFLTTPQWLELVYRSLEGK